jgi:hypothetical protein
MNVYLETNLWNALCATILWMRTRSWGRSAPAASIWASVIIASPKLPRLFGGRGVQSRRRNVTLPSARATNLWLEIATR